MNPWLLVLIITLVVGLIVAVVLVVLKVTGHFPGGSSSTPTSNPANEKPLTPTKLQAGFVSTTSIDLSWAASTGASTYQISYQVATASTMNVYNTTDQTSLTVTGLQASTAYNFQVVAVNSNGNSSAAVLNGIQTASAPPLPTNFVATTITTTSIALSWSPSSGASTYTVNYAVSGSSNWTTASSTITNTNTTITGLTSGTIYNFQLIASNTSGSSNPVSLNGVQTGAPPDSPTNIVVSSVTGSSIGLSWSPVSGAASYSVSYQLSSDSTWTFFGNAAGTSVVVVGLKATTIYNFQIIATNTYGSSTPGVINTIQTGSASSGSPPNPPTNLLVTQTGATSITLAWDSMSGATSYNISYQTLGAVAWTAYQSTSATTLAVKGLTLNTTYNFQVSASNLAGVSNASILNNIQTIAPPAGVTGLSSGSITTTSVALSWNAGSDAVNYTVNYQTTSATTWTAFGGPVTSSNVNVTGLSSGVTYNFQVIANNTSGPSAAATLSGITTGAPPASPTNFQSGTLTSTTVPLVWNSSPGAATYTISYQVVGSGNWTVFGGPVATTSTTVTGLTSGSTYSFKIVASNTYGDSSPQYLNNILTPTLPGVPGNLQTGTITSTSVVLNWLSATQSTNYNINYQIDGTGSTWINFATTANLTCNVTNLQSNTSYNFEVIGVNSFGSGTPATLNQILTLTPPVVIPSQPTNFHNTNNGVGTGGEVTFFWDPTPGATSYTLSYSGGGGATYVYGSTSDTTITMGLNPTYTYTLSLTASNSAGTGPAATCTVAKRQ